MITRSVSSSLLAIVLPVSLAGPTHAASLTYDADTGDTGAQDGSGTGWTADAGNTGFWTGSANAAWPNTNADDITFGAGSGAAGVVTVGTVTTNKITFAAAAGNYSLTGGTITLAGATPTLAVNNDASIGSALAGTAGMTKSGTAALTLSGTNTYTGATSVTAGSVAYTGVGAYTGGGGLSLGAASGSRSMLDLASSGTITHGNATAAAAVTIGGSGGAGAIHLGSGTLNLRHNSNYLPMGNAGYGSFVADGGTLNFTNDTGIIIGQGAAGLGEFRMTAGSVNLGNRLFIVGGSGTSTGVATLTGGTLTCGFEYKLADGGTGQGTLNVGTAAGGTALMKVSDPDGIQLGATSGTTATGTVNLNRGTIQFNGSAGPIQKGTGTGVVNLNGATLQANAAGRTLITNTPTKVNVYNGGLTVDTQSFGATVSANLLATTGNGIYPSGGVINLPAAAGTGYIGAPLVTVTTSGTGTGAMAVANVVDGQITGVTMTCPGQGYNAGETVTFTYAGGGPATAAAPFVYTLTSGDLAANGAGGLTKLGTGTLTLSGANTFSGPVSITGSVVTNTLSLNNTTLAIHGFDPASPSAPLQANTSLTTGGTVQVQVDGIFTPGSKPLIYYPYGGSIGGSGISALQLQTGSLPRGVVATLVDSPATSSVNLNVTGFNPLTWKGAVNQVWDINTTSNWLIGATAQKYLENDLVRFNDSATGSTNVTLNTTVQPQSVTFDNNIKNYILSGTGSIAGNAAISKTNTGTVTFLNANTTTGVTMVSGGTLQLGNGSTNGSVAGPLVNNAKVIFNPAGTSPALTGDLGGDSSGIFTKSGPGTQVLVNAANTSDGTFQVNAGTLQFGNGVSNGALGSAFYEVATGATLHLNYATAVQALTDGWASKVSGAGILELSSAQPVNGSAKWGPDSAAATPLSESFTGTLKINQGRFDASPAGLGGTGKIVINSGAQFLAWPGTYSRPIELAGTGWGEDGYASSLRLAANATAAWEGSVSLTGDTTIMAQRGANLTITGAITGGYTCEFYAGDPYGENGTVTVAPAVAGQNTYAATKVNGRPGGSIVAGSAQAFSSGPLVVESAILKLNGHDLSFANLSGAGGAIGNYHATTPATLTVGSDNSSTTYAGTLRNGDVAPLALTKTGTGTLTLTAASSYSGNTTVSQGTLALATPSLADTSTVTIAPGAVLELNGGADTIGSLVLGTTTLTSGIYNAAHPSYGSYFSGTGSLIIGGAYDGWAASKGLDGSPGKEKGPTDDPDKDGIQNLAEFYLDGDPLANDQAILPVATLDATYLTLTFKRRDDAEGDVVTQAIQYGTTLASGSWTDVALGTTDFTSPAGVKVTVTENEAAPDTIKVEIPRTLSGTSGKLFGRLNIAR